MSTRTMGDCVHCDSSSVTTVFKDSALTDSGFSSGAVPDTARRVRFLAELTISINHTSDSSPTVHSSYEQSIRPQCAAPVVGPTGSCYSKKQTTCDGDRDMVSREPVQFQRWRTDRKEREAKMEQNIKWLREEIAKLKEQDQSLMRQFLQLRSVIYQIKGTMKANKGTFTKLPRIAASTDSMVRSQADAEALVVRLAGDGEEEPFDDDDLNELDDTMGLMEESYLPEFRNRTVSLLDPSKMGRGRGGGAAECGGYGYLKSRTMSFSVGASARELDRAIVE